MTRTQFTEAAEALFGPSWRAALSTPLRVSERTIRRWADGDSRLPYGIGDNMAKLCRAHSAKLAKIADQIEGK